MASAQEAGVSGEGRATFESGCAVYHSVAFENAVVVGPSLGCAFGRVVGPAHGFRYCEVLWGK